MTLQTCDSPEEAMGNFPSGDGAHCGLGDWYPRAEEWIKSSLKEAKKNNTPFDTKWYSSKKEIASARISYDGVGSILIEVSVSDDFDTNGMGHATTPIKSASLEKIRKAIYRAWDLANENQKSNRDYAGYALIHWTTKVPEWMKDRCWPKPKSRYRSKQPQCLDYYIVNISGLDSPPGDNYSHWGWSNDDPECDDPGTHCVTAPEIPPKVLKQLEDWADGLNKGSLRIGDWEMREWED